MSKTVYRATARNFAADTENRIHSDEVAAQFGFSGALVPGAAVFGHMTHALVDTLGPGWLAGFSAELSLLKPAYDGDELSIEITPGEKHAHDRDGNVQEYEVLCQARGQLLARLRSRRKRVDEGFPLEVPKEPDVAAVAERPEIHWDNVEVGEPFPAWTWTPDAVANAEAAAQVDDDLPCYQAGLLHPHAILSAANRAFTRRYVLPAWIHVGSVIRLHRPLFVDDEIRVHTVPVRKWRKRNYEFVDLDIAFSVTGGVATEIKHTSIFHVIR